MPAKNRPIACHTGVPHPRSSRPYGLSLGEAAVVPRLLVRIGTLGLILATTFTAGPLPDASAAGEDGSSTTHHGPGSSSQYMYWDISEHRVRMKMNPGDAMPDTVCQDVKLDWGTEGSGHYDARVTRVCKPGGHIQTNGDSSTSGHWVEPAGFEGRDVERIREAVAYTISDDSPLWVLSSPSPSWAFKVSRDDNVYNNGNSAHPLGHAPKTRTSWWARVRTRYNNGDVNYSQNLSLPFSCPRDPAGGACS